jgi:hypothetical protein
MHSKYSLLGRCLQDILELYASQTDSKRSFGPWKED